MSDLPTEVGPEAPVVYPAEPPLAHQAVRGGWLVALSSYWSIGFGFAVNIMLTRLLPAQAFGDFAYAGYFTSLFLLQPKLALGTGFAQHKETTEETLGTYFTMEMALALGSIAVALIALPLLPRSTVPLVVVLTVAAVLQGIAAPFTLLLDKELQFGRTSLLTVVATTISYAPALWLAMNGGGVWSLVAQSVMFGTIIFIGSLWLSRHNLPRIWQARGKFNLMLARRFAAFGIVVGIGAFAASQLTTFDNFLVGTFVGMTALGYYDRGYRTAQWPALLFNALSSRAAFFTYARLQDDAARLQKAATMLLWLITTVTVPLVLVIFITAPDLITLLYTARWLPSAPILRILILVSAVRPIWENAGMLFSALGKPRIMTAIIVGQLAVLVAAGIPLTKAWGAIGTCTAVGLAFAVGMVLIYRYLRRDVPIEIWSVVGVPAMAGALTLLGYLVLDQVAPLDELGLAVRVAVKSVYALVAFFVFAFAMQPATTRERLAYVWRLTGGR